MSLARAQAWSIGLVAQWYLRHYQRSLYQFINRHKNPVIVCSRRFGKTTTILAFVVEQLIKHPGWIARWCFPEKGQAIEIMNAAVDKLNRTAPDERKLVYQVTGSVFNMQNGSKLYVRGVNEDRGESARGAAANIIVADEFGFWREAAYIAREVLRPQLDKQEGRWFIRTSTPPRDLNHPFYHEVEQAEIEGRCITKTIQDRDDLTEAEFAEIVKECGGIETPAFKRNYMCEKVSDPEMLVTPEFSDRLWPEGNVLPDSDQRPEFFTAYVGGDSGADDNTFVLFGYYDFERDLDVIEREWVGNNATTKEIIDQAKAIEFELWKGQQPKKRVYDADKQLIFDIYRDHKWPVQMPDKADKRASIHDLRRRIGERRFVVKENCKHTIRQLLTGLWRDDKHLDFQRSEALGHLDGIAAALYFQRSLERSINPVPHHLGLRKETHWIQNTSQSSPDKSTDALASVFGSRRVKGW